MSQVSITGLSKRFSGKVPAAAIDGLDLEIEPGEMLVLLGPSGCGKTTTLRCLAGLEKADDGQIAFGDRSVFDAARRVNIAPHKRNIGMVFQSYALWPHMTVRKNIGYPLAARRVDRATAGLWIEEVAALVECSHLLDRYPGQLSGGQQQRVALCRGLVARPDLLLFDEPLSSLDARLRDQVRTQIHELHRRIGFTGVYVTHDQSEALALGDRMAIMRAGKIEQLGRPDEVFERPATEYVAEFIGMANRLKLSRVGDGWLHEQIRIEGVGPIVERAIGGVALRFRADDVVLVPQGESVRDAVALPATLLDAQFGGLHVEAVVQVGDTRLYSRLRGDQARWIRTLVVGAPLVAAVRLADVTTFDDAGKRVETVNGAGAATSVIGV